MADITHPSFPQPVNPEIPIWRYMDITKLLWILQNNALYFARADCLGDPFEGHYTRSAELERNSLIEQVCADHPKGSPERLECEQSMTITFEMSLRYRREAKTDMFVSCWHMNEQESSAMWKLYTSMNDAVCIKSTYKKLGECLPYYTNLGRVNYINYELEHIGLGNTFNLIMHKRLSYAHEHEARAVFWIKQDVNLQHLPPEGVQKFGQTVPVNAKDLIMEIYVSPSSSALLLDVITKMVRSFGLTIPVKQSEVNAPPGY